MERFSRTPHDAIFRQMLAQKEVARDFLQLYLPAQFLSICDLNTLQLASGSFIEEDLRSSYSDILYSLQTQHGAGYIYALIEHQSSPDKLMAFRLMRYTLAAMQRHLDAGHNTLPLVVPILFYHGTVSPWPHTLNWLQLFDLPELAGALYGGDFPLVDLTVMPDNHILRQAYGDAGTVAKAYSPARSGRTATDADYAAGAMISDGKPDQYPHQLYAAGGNHGKTRAPDSRAGEAVAQAQGATDDNCRMAGRERP